MNFWQTIQYDWYILKLLWKEWRNAGQKESDPDDN